MRITTERTSMRIKRVVRVDEGPVIAMAYSATGRQFRVEWIQVEYKWQDGEWVVNSAFSVELGGYVLKKDGQPSKNWHVSNPDWDYRERRFKDGYEFAQKIIDELRPSGDLSMSIFQDYEVA